MSIELLEKAAYKKAMKVDAAKWRKLLKSNCITFTTAYAAFSAQYPDTLSYEGFHKNLTASNFTFSNYNKAKQFFSALENKIEELKTIQA